MSVQSSDSAASTAAHAHRNVDPAQRAVYVGEGETLPLRVANLQMNSFLLQLTQRRAGSVLCGKR